MFWIKLLLGKHDQDVILMAKLEGCESMKFYITFYPNLKSMKKIYAPFILSLLLTNALLAQSPEKGWEKWQYLIGEWKGEGSGQPGSGAGMFTLKPKLGGSILERKGKTEIGATATQPATIHEDVMIIYKNREGNPVRSIYFDNENHVINYDISYSDNKIILTSEPNPAAPRFRLIYEMLENKLMNTRFEMAMPNAPEVFKTYIEGKSVKVKELAEMPK